VILYQDENVNGLISAHKAHTYKLYKNAEINYVGLYKIVKH